MKRLNKQHKPTHQKTQTNSIERPHKQKRPITVKAQPYKQQTPKKHSPFKSITVTAENKKCVLIITHPKNNYDNHKSS